jgi:acyl-CoA thioester hydrolase
MAVKAKVFKTQVRVAWVETDAAQVVHFSNYFRYFEKAEEEFYRHLGFSFSSAADRGLWFPRVETFCQYRKPAHFSDLLEVELIVEEMREKSVKYGFKILKKESMALIAEGHVVLVAASMQTGKATTIPNDFADKLKPYTKQFLYG